MHGPMPDQDKCYVPRRSTVAMPDIGLVSRPAKQLRSQRSCRWGQRQRMAGQLRTWVIRGLAPETVRDSMRSFLGSVFPGLVAIVLVGVGQKCWLCPTQPWSATFQDLDWIPEAAKVERSGFYRFFDEPCVSL